MLSASWSGRLAPMITLVTCGWCSSQARATCATDTPWACAMGRMAAMHASARTRLTGGKSKLARRLPASAGAALLSLALALAYLPLSRPPASGLHTIRPTPSLRSIGISSRSRSRPATV